MSTAHDLDTASSIQLGTTALSERDFYDNEDTEIPFFMSLDNLAVETMLPSEPPSSLSTVVENPTSVLDSPQGNPYTHTPISENQSSEEEFNSFMSWYVRGTIMPPTLPSLLNQNEANNDYDDLEDAVSQGMVNSAGNQAIPMTSNWQVELSVSAVPTAAPDSISSFSNMNCNLSHPPPNQHLFMHQQGIPSPYSLSEVAYASNPKKRAFMHDAASMSQLLPAVNADDPISAQKLGVPPTKKLKGLRTPLNYGSKRLESDLIRDGIPPAKYDEAEAKLVYDVAMRRKDIDFTFSAHFELLKQSLYDQLVVKLNEKLSDGLELENLQLVRDMSGDERNLNLNDIHHAMIRFAKSGVQRKIDWVFCQEHLDLLYDLNLNKPELSLEELDKLVKATGVWILLQGQNQEAGRKKKGKKNKGRKNDGRT